MHHRHYIDLAISPASLTVLKSPLVMFGVKRDDLGGFLQICCTYKIGDRVDKKMVTFKLYYGPENNLEMHLRSK